ncbi:YdiU family protein [Snodgrassella sp. CFCC 13594]|uniref:protein adenylyltransferase SelO n=1 Tax=Snodgrassella sp. CFCC 13594 TaxID=1775559 RepID=UPI000B20C7A9|nr:YdiU family protein [Snodgrassella sp. CFCC 13594]
MHTLPLQPPRLTTLPDAYYHPVLPTPLNHPFVMAYNSELAQQLGLPEHFLQQADNLLALSGSLTQWPHPPLATVYSGHQFGVYVPQLGDGRALILGESTDTQGHTWEWQLKGAGPTPFSRFADGRAVMRSSIREYLCSEAMQGLGIPTTRALTLIGSPDQARRKGLEPTAIVTRLAPSFLRFGHFEYFYHRGEHALIRPLADYLIEHYFADCAEADEPYLALFQAITQRSAALVASWQSVGFVHGVLNTDNMSLLGLTIDYGPFGFMDRYQPRFEPNSSDENRRYAYDQQPYIVQWNLSMLASAMQPLVATDDLLSTLQAYVDWYLDAYQQRMRAKLGLTTTQADDGAFIEDLLDEMHTNRVDFTLFFRYLSDFDPTHPHVIPARLAQLWRDTATCKHGYNAMCCGGKQKIAYRLSASVQWTASTPYTYCAIICSSKQLSKHRSNMIFVKLNAYKPACVRRLLSSNNLLILRFQLQNGPNTCA